MKTTSKISEIKNIPLIFKIKDEELQAEISPCSWMYPHYGLKIKVTAVSEKSKLKGSEVTCHTKKVKYSDATLQDVIDLTKQVIVKECTKSGCSNLQFFEEDSKRTTLCHSCHEKEFYKKYYSDMISEVENQKSYCEKQISAGFKFVATVQSWANGDDQINDYFLFSKSQLNQLNLDLSNCNIKLVNINDFFSNLEKQIINIKNELKSKKIEEF